MIKVLLVDDSPLAIIILKRMLAKSQDIEVVGTAINGREALKLIPQVQPDVICTDLHMPVMNGLELTREIMATHPKPILLVSISAYESSLSAFEVLEAGAVELFPKPDASSERDYERIAPLLIRKIKILAGVRVFRRPRADTTGSGTSVAKQIQSTVRIPSSCVRVVIIGASTGGPAALQAILTQLPAAFSLPIICIQHINEGFLQGLVDWLSPQCRVKIETAKAGEIPRPGTVYFPQDGTHLQFDQEGRFVSSSAPLWGGHRPSVTVTMSSAAKYYGTEAFCVLLTGMGRDGAEGMLDVKQAGGITVAQDEESSIVFGMPKAAIEMGAAGYVIPLNAIGSMILMLDPATSGGSLDRPRKSA